MVLRWRSVLKRRDGTILGTLRGPVLPLAVLTGVRAILHVARAHLRGGGAAALRREPGGTVREQSRAIERPLVDLQERL